ncbi:MAG: phosphoglycerate dehydrogenase [Clostridiaceae bacterium]|nr:phosphoglycerate dehydrogenase [Clostridiaceae bacterium]
MKILVTPTSFQKQSNSPALSKLLSYSENIVFNEKMRPLKEDELISLIGDCDGYIAGLDNITEKVIRSAPKLKVISRYGVGIDSVDLKAASKRGIIVTNTPNSNSQAVAELAIASMFVLARNLIKLNNTTKEGQWIRNNGIELANKTLGILGIGAIGSRVAIIAKGIGMEVLAIDPCGDVDFCKKFGIELLKNYDELYKISDFISLHVPLTESTYHMIDSDVFSKMKKGSFLINVSRGGLIDEVAAYQALQSGSLAGMALDAFEEEPPKSSPLLSLDNVFVTPHTGAHTIEAINLMGQMAVDNLISVLENKPCQYIVNM